jgi:hypothetical protein
MTASVQPAMLRIQRRKRKFRRRRFGMRLSGRSVRLLQQIIGRTISGRPGYLEDTYLDYLPHPA